jgi:hypothetical protein
MHGSHCYACGSSSPTTGRLRAALALIRDVRWLACAATLALCSNAAGAPLAYPTTATPFVTSPTAGTAAQASVAISPNLSQPIILATATSPIAPADSVNVPGFAQPQILVTDHPVPAPATCDWRTKKADSTTDKKTDSTSDKKTNSTSDKDGKSDSQSGWSILWRQATGMNTSSAIKPAAARVANSPSQTVAQSSKPADASAKPKVQLLPAVPPPQGLLPSVATTSANSAAANQPGVTSAGKELSPAKSNSVAAGPQSQGPAKQASYDSLASQLGLAGSSDVNTEVQHSTKSSTDVSSSARTQPSQAAESTSNTGPSNSGQGGLMSQLLGESNLRQSRDSGGAPDNRRRQAQATNTYPQTASDQQSATNSPEASSPPPKGFWGSLAQPFTMQTNDAPIRRPSASHAAATPSTTEQADDDVAESESVPQLLAPFYHTNGSPQPGHNESSVAKARSTHHGPDLEQSVRSSKLTQQLAMTTGDKPKSKTSDVADVALHSEHDGWDAGWTQTDPNLAPFRTIAYLQEPMPTPSEGAPEPEKINLPGEENASQGDQTEKTGGEAGEGGQAKKKADNLETADKLGPKPEDRSLDFLRTETVLLKPGKYQFDIGFSYQIQERNFPILFRTVDPTNPVDDAHFLTTDGQTVGLVADEARFKTREFLVPMQLRYGLYKRVQLFLAAPVGWSNTEVDLSGRDEFKNDGGIGDINFGATVQLQEAEADCPYVVGTGFVTAPSGGDPFTGAALFSPSAPSLGNGFWKLNGNLLFIQPLDPVTFFYGAGIRGSFEHEYIGANFEPGLEYTYTFGLGFAINEKVTLSSQLFGEYQSRLQVNGVGLEGSSQEPIALQLAATIARPCDRLVEPFISFGLTEDAVAANFGITWTY